MATYSNVVISHDCADTIDMHKETVTDLLLAFLRNPLGRTGEKTRSELANFGITVIHTELHHGPREAVRQAYAKYK